MARNDVCLPAIFAMRPAEPAFDFGAMDQFSGQRMDDETRIDAEAVRLTAFFLWEQDGRPPGRDWYYWRKAKEQHIRELAYDRWLAEGSPEGQAESHWQDAQRRLRLDAS